MKANINRTLIFSKKMANFFQICHFFFLVQNVVGIMIYKKLLLCLTKNLKKNEIFHKKCVAKWILNCLYIIERYKMLFETKYSKSKYDSKKKFSKKKAFMNII
jgi:hypothetical protein